MSLEKGPRIDHRVYPSEPPWDAVCRWNGNGRHRDGCPLRDALSLASESVMPEIGDMLHVDALPRLEFFLCRDLTFVSSYQL